MEDLPQIPVMKIIDYLSIEDILNLKLVNKWFYQIINENVRINDLVISTQDDLPYNRRWFYTCDLINLKDSIKYVSNYNIYLNLNLNKPVLSQLKQLFISYTPITLKTLNSLDRLVHLEIIECKIENIFSFFPECISDNNVLSLPMLEIFNLYATDLKKNWSEGSF